VLGEEEAEVGGEARHCDYYTDAHERFIGVIRRLLPYLWEFKGRVFLALALLVSGEARQHHRAPS
jgi:hypothetical protein